MNDEEFDKFFRIEVDGAFECQQCDEYVESAHYLPDPKILAWECSKGHRSILEKFAL